MFINGPVEQSQSENKGAEIVVIAQRINSESKGYVLIWDDATKSIVKKAR